MKITVRLASRLQRLAGAPARFPLDLADCATVKEAVQHLAAQHPRLAESMRSAVFVVEGQLVDGSHGLAAGQELGIIEPVAGGSRIWR